MSKVAIGVCLKQHKYLKQHKILIIFFRHLWSWQKLYVKKLLPRFNICFAASRFDDLNYSKKLKNPICLSSRNVSKIGYLPCFQISNQDPPIRQYLLAIGWAVVGKGGIKNVLNTFQLCLMLKTNKFLLGCEKN